MTKKEKAIIDDLLKQISELRDEVDAMRRKMRRPYYPPREIPPDPPASPWRLPVYPWGPRIMWDDNLPHDGPTCRITHLVH